MSGGAWGGCPDPVPARLTARLATLSTEGDWARLGIELAKVTVFFLTSSRAS